MINTHLKKPNLALYGMFLYIWRNTVMWWHDRNFFQIFNERYLASRLFFFFFLLLAHVGTVEEASGHQGHA